MDAIKADHDNTLGRCLHRLTIFEIVPGQTAIILIPIQYIVHDVIALILAARFPDDFVSPLL